MTTRPYQMCVRCVMDTSAVDITFDEHGVCNYCTAFLAKTLTLPEDSNSLALRRNSLHNSIRETGKGKRYDCIVGVSGGADSSYALYLAVQNGLRPLAVHLDNGWDSELAQNNIANLVRRLSVDLYTHVIDWPENRDMQLAMMRADVIDVEMIMDNAQAATTYRQACKYGLRHIVSGVNSRTEGMPIPEGWYHYKFDVRNIRSIHKKFGSIPIRTHPLMRTLTWLYYMHGRRIKYHKYLDFFMYNKTEAIAILKRELDYVPYRYKHNESVFTRFYQNYMLPIKFGIDKRRVHHSNQICTGEMTREQALRDLAENVYIESGEAEADKLYVIKKLGMSEGEFREYMARPPVRHDVYPSEIRRLHTVVLMGQSLKRLTNALLRPAIAGIKAVSGRKN